MSTRETSLSLTRIHFARLPNSRSTAVNLMRLWLTPFDPRVELIGRGRRSVRCWACRNRPLRGSTPRSLCNGALFVDLLAEFHHRDV